MKQAFTSSSFDWLSQHRDSTGEFIGNHVVNWSSNPSKSTLQNFLLAGIGGKNDASSCDTLTLLRQYLNPLAWPLDENQCLFDSGDLIDWTSEDMRDTIVAGLIEQAIHDGILPIIVQSESQAGFGLFAGASLSSMGDVDAAFPGYIRLSSTLLTMSMQTNEPSIGSSMAALAKRCGQSFHGLQLGVQEAINPKSAWVEAAALGINALTLAACEQDLLFLYLRNFCKDVQQVILSIDLDVLSEPYAPGDHRGTSFGLSLEVLLPAIRWLAGEGKLLGIELTGVGTGESQRGRRPRLAASITQDLLSHWF